MCAALVGDLILNNERQKDFIFATRMSDMQSPEYTRTHTGSKSSEIYYRYMCIASNTPDYPFNQTVFDWCTPQTKHFEKTYHI